MDAFDVYRTFISVKLHFCSKDYNYFTYHGQVSASPEAFQSNKKKYGFVKLARAHDEKDFPYFLALAFMNKGKKLWVGNITKDNSYNKEFSDWKLWQETRVENFIKDLTFMKSKCNIKTVEEFSGVLKIIDGQLPRIFVEYEEGNINLSTILILDNYLGSLDNWNKKLHGTFTWDDFYDRASKFRMFFRSWKPLSDINIMNAINECLKNK